MLIFQDYTHLQFENFYFDAQLLKRTRFSISTEKYKTPTPRCVDEGRDRNKADIRKKTKIDERVFIVPFFFCTSFS